MKLLKETIESIEPINQEATVEAREFWDSLVHPIGSLGKLEEIGIKLAGIHGHRITSIPKRGIVVMASDNGIVDADVTSSPQELTWILTKAMADKYTGVSQLAIDANAEVIIVDMGMKVDLKDERVISRRISPCTKNFLIEDAMSYEDAVQSIETGIEIADRLFADGYDILGTGELGMGNTTTSAAVLAALLGLSAEETVGQGSGVSPEQFEKKLNAVKNGIELRKPNLDDPVDVLAKIGGYDIGGLTGVFLSAAKNKKPVVIDGIISAAAAVTAYKLCEHANGYMFGSHVTREKGAAFGLEAMGVDSYVSMEMRLGEGSGCPLAFKLIDSALFAMNHMGTYEQSKVLEGVLFNIRDNE
ncbi:MAG: nicotinate-nucleotide--dimethylbenzimidazole phosphoribosyltransferase [Tissierellia bacterium]|nr:nicotinate-nucleotide--dimethylbenzimidazole phosphoribosyltransferase [Tissierellia bacterium]